MQVLKQRGAKFDQEIAYSPIRAGQVVRRHELHDWYLVPARADESFHQMAGIAMHDAESGDPVQFAITGLIQYEGFDLIDGMVYVISPDEAGVLMPFSLLPAGHFVHVVGVAKRDNQLQLWLESARIQLGTMPEPIDEMDTQPLPFFDGDDTDGY